MANSHAQKYLIFFYFRMSKKAGHTKYNKKWEREFPWLEPVHDNINQASCKYCRQVMKAKLDIVRAHGLGLKHKNRSPFVNEKGKSHLPFKPVTVIPIELKKVELKLTMMAVCHTSFKAVNHISELVRKEGEGSYLQKIKLHRTKERR